MIGWLPQLSVDTKILASLQFNNNKRNRKELNQLLAALQDLRLPVRDAEVDNSPVSSS